MKRPRAAHFLLHPELATSPPNEALISALLELGFDVDIYSPRAEPIGIAQYGDRVRGGQVEYGLRFVARNVLRPFWRRYSLFSGTTEDPIGLAGPLAAAARAPLVTLADEIYSGAYTGGRPRRWKALCRWGMRRSVLTIVNDPSRVALQRDYAGLAPDRPVIVYPGCFRRPPAPRDRAEVRRERGIPGDAFVVAFSGLFSLDNGGVWAARLLAERPDICLWGQLLGTPPFVRSLLPYLRGADRLFLEDRRLSWTEAWESIVAADVGLAIYLNEAPQFRHMGTSSNRLCMFLAMGVPVIASRQPSFDFLEQFGCGVQVDDAQGLIAAVDMVRRSQARMTEAASRCAREYVAAPARYGALREALRHATERVRGRGSRPGGRRDPTTRIAVTIRPLQMPN